LFSDTLTAQGRFVRNAAAINAPDRTGRPRFTFHSGTDGHGFIRSPGDPAELWYWPAAALPPSGGPYVHFSAVRVGIDPDAPPPFTFRAIGTRIISFANGAGGPVRVGTAPTPRIRDWSGSPISWSAASTASGKHAYLYGVGRERDGRQWGHAVYVARVPLRNLDRRRPVGFEVRTVAGWRDPDGVTVGRLRQVGRNFSTVFAVNSQPDGSVLAAVKTYELLGRTVDGYRASAPGRPFRRVRTLVVLPDIEDAFSYWVTVHPDLPAPEGKVWAATNHTPIAGPLVCGPFEPRSRPTWYLLPSRYAPAATRVAGFLARSESQRLR
jgi:hypothetical protein